MNVWRHRVLDVCGKLLQGQCLVDEVLDVLQILGEQIF